MKQRIHLILLVAFFTAGCSTSTPSTISTAPAIPGTSLFESTTVPAMTESIPTEAVVGEVETNDKCTNPYYPVHNGAWWMYNAAGVMPAHTLTTQGGNQFTVTVQTGDGSSMIKGQCTDEGIILLDAPSLSTQFPALSGDPSLIVSHVNGATLIHNVQTGNRWSQIIQVSSGNLNGAIEIAYTAHGSESLTFTAGRFNALKVEFSGSLNLNGQTFIAHGFTWYAPNLGVVKSVTDGATSSELFAYNFP